jgi:NADPH:quinone reductase-like Zn-dependent oxidoreductase
LPPRHELHATFDGTAQEIGSGGNVGAYAVQLARRAGGEVIAVARQAERDYLRSLSPDRIIDPEETWPSVDVVLDTVGGEMQSRSFDALPRG